MADGAFIEWLRQEREEECENGDPADDWMSMCHFMILWSGACCHLFVIGAGANLQPSNSSLVLLYYCVHRLNKATEGVLIPLCFLASQ